MTETVTGSASNESKTATQHGHQIPGELAIDALNPTQSIFPKGFFQGEDKYADFDDQRAFAVVEAIFPSHPDVTLAKLSQLFNSNDNVLEHISESPFGTVEVVDEMTNATRVSPILEAPATAKIRDRMAVAGLTPLARADTGQIIFAYRLDEKNEQALGNAYSEAQGILEELDKASNDGYLAGSQIVIVPVSKDTYDFISSASIDPEFRDQQAIRACDEYFMTHAPLADFLEDTPKLVPMMEAYPNSPIRSVIADMHFDPFIEVARKTSGVAKPTDEKHPETSGTTVKNVQSIFDDRNFPNISLLLERGSRTGFLPLKVEEGNEGKPVIVLGFRTHEDNHHGGMRKVEWADVVERLDDYRKMFFSVLKDHFPKDMTSKDFKLVPIPNTHFDDLSRQINDHDARKHSLSIIDRTVGTLNYQQLIDYAVRNGAQEIWMHQEGAGPSVRFGVGASVVQAPFQYSTESFRATIRALTAIMSNKITNHNQPFEGQIRFSGMQPTDFAKWEDSFAKGEPPSIIPGSENLNMYPRSLEGISLRLQFTPTITGDQLVIRIHRMQKNPPALRDLSFRPEAMKAFARVLKINSGLILFTAPTGSGKSNSMAALIREKKDGRVVMTMENPVEFRIPGVSQVDINEAAGRTPLAVLKSFLRSAPGIIMMGEIRDAEEASIALQAGLTGHLLLSTLHTNDAPEAMIRLLNMKLDPFFLGSAVNAIVSQRLIPQFKKVPHSLEYIPDPRFVTRYDCAEELAELIGRPGAFDLPIPAYKSKTKDSYSGRVPVNEFIIPTPELRAMFNKREGWDMSELIHTLRNQKSAEVKFEPMVIAGLRWVFEGRSSLSALYDGDKVIPVSQFRLYADEIVDLVKQYQAASMH